MGAWDGVSLLTQDKYKMRNVRLIFLVAIVAMTTACAGQSPAAIATTSSGAATTPTAGLPNSEQAPAPTPVTTGTPQNTATQAPGPESQESASAQGWLVLEVATGTEARYRVKEQLARLNLPTDAVGVTQQVEGKITLDQDNTIVAEESKLVVDLRTLQSDESRRDNYIRRNTLVTALYPLAEFVPRSVVGLPAPLPKSGEARFQILGDMTVHGVTRPLTWDVNASFSDQEIVAQATASFRFGYFNMAIPRVFMVLSVEDNIRLEIDLRLRLTEAGL